MEEIDEALKDIIKGLKAKKESLTKKRNVYIDSTNDLNVKIANANRLLEESIRKEQEQVSDETLIRKQKSQNEDLNQELWKLKSQEENLKQNLLGLRKKVNNMNTILANSSNYYKEKKDSLEKLQNDIPLLHQRIDELVYKLENIEIAQKNLKNLESDYSRANALKNILIVKLEATEELLHELQDSNNTKYNEAKLIYDNASSNIDILREI